MEVRLPVIFRSHEEEIHLPSHHGEAIELSFPSEDRACLLLFFLSEFLEFQLDLPVKSKHQVTYYSEHHHLEAQGDEKERKDGHGKMFHISEPFYQNIHSGDRPPGKEQDTNQTEVEERVVHSCQAVDGSNDAKTILEGF
jgi:hypothetical protein